MSTVKESSGLTVVELERLKALGLNPTGNKSELITRLIEADPSGTWLQTDSEASKTDSASTAAVPATVDYQRKIEMCKQEKELAERELALARAELQLLRGMQGPGVSDQERQVEQDPVTMMFKLSIMAIADLLGHFNGNTDDYRNWEQQLTLLRKTYELTESYKS